MSQNSAKDKWIARLTETLGDGSFVKLTLSMYRGGDTALKNVMVRPVELQDGPRLSFVYRYARRDVTKNFEREEAIELLDDLVGPQFMRAHLFSTQWLSEIEFREGRPARLTEGKAVHAEPPSKSHDKERTRSIIAEKSPWLQALDVTMAGGKIARGMEAKFRQINKFVELLTSLLPETSADAALSVVDMGCGKGYLTFAAYDSLQRGGKRCNVRGIETRPELVELCNRVARESHFEHLSFEPGDIAEMPLEHTDVLIALHACDTATDDAIAKGIAASAKLILVSPCCHKELRPQLVPPPPLAPALQHGILLEREAEFVTDALRAALLEWAGYDTKVFEFISTEHTGKNLMIAATKRKDGAHRENHADQVRELARLYGIRQQRLARQLGFNLTAESQPA